MTRACQNQVQATEVDMKEFSMQSKPSSKSGKCLHACLMESIGLVILEFFSSFNPKSYSFDFNT